MTLVQSEDARDLELLGDLKQAYQHYIQTGDAKREEARAVYLAKLREFTTRVLGNSANG
jgi:hypothetical protein